MVLTRSVSQGRLSVTEPDVPLQRPRPKGGVCPSSEQVEIRTQKGVFSIDII